MVFNNIDIKPRTRDITAPVKPLINQGFFYIIETSFTKGETFLMKSNFEFWSIKRMIEYAELSYHINPEYFHSMHENKLTQVSVTNYNNCERQLQRMIKDNKMASDNPNTKKLDYELPEPIAKCFIDTMMKSYFDDIIYISEDMVAEYYKGKDNEFSNKSFDAFEVYQQMAVKERDGEDISAIDSAYPHDYSYSIDKYIKIDCDMADENQVINQMMIRAIFNTLFEFNESAYREDYEKYLSLCDDSHPQDSYGSGYSELKDKLDHPEKYYYQPKKK